MLTREKNARTLIRAVWPAIAAIACMVPAHATNLFINPTFASNITSDSNAANIENAINIAIGNFESAFSDPITVDITFQEGGGLGSSSTVFFSGVNYKTYCNDLKADAKTASDATALATLAPGGVCPTNNPVTGDSTINVKSANLRAIGIATPGVGPGGVADGTITLNTSLTNPGSSGTTSQYSLIVVAEHEIDEVLGLGSALEGVGSGTVPTQNGDVFPEDLFRYTSGGARTFSAGASCTGLANNAFFSINGGVTDLAQFNNACNGGDFGDWAVVGSPKVQDYAGTPGSSPSLGPEITALDVIGYDATIPEPGTFLLVGGGLLGAFLLRLRQDLPAFISSAQPASSSPPSAEHSHCPPAEPASGSAVRPG
jgi:hypothetical protein